MIIDLFKHLTPTYSASIKDSFTTNMKDDCPIVSYSITNVIDKNYKKPIALEDCSNLFNLDSQGIFSVLQSIQSYHNYLIYAQAKN